MQLNLCRFGLMGPKSVQIANDCMRAINDLVILKNSGRYGR